MKVLLVTDPLPADQYLAAIRAIAPDVSVVAHRRDLDDAELEPVQAVLAWRLPARLASRLPRLQWVCSTGAGAEKLLVDDLAPHVAVSRIVDSEQAEGIAQFVVLMALRHVRQLELYQRQQSERVWKRNPVSAVRSRVGVLGMGAMGSKVAEKLAAVGFEVRGHTRRSGGDLDALLEASDIVVCALPLTNETEGLLDARAFARMPRGSYLINIARGAHVVEPDLVASVTSGHLAGAALDVQRREPMPADDPLWNVPGITITPHIAAQSAFETIAGQFVAGLRAIERNELPANRIDRVKGY